MRFLWPIPSVVVVVGAPAAVLAPKYEGRNLVNAQNEKKEAAIICHFNILKN